MAGDKEAREGEDLYVLRADFMRYVRTLGYKPNGQPLNESKRYEKGDSISLSEEEAERYLRSGAVVKSDEYDESKQAEEDAARRAEADKVLSSMAADPTRAGQVSGHLVGLEDAAPEPKTEEPIEVDGIEVEDVDGLPEDPDAETDIEPEAEGEVQDEYTDMAYPDLVQEAKAKTGNGGGTKEELLARLREHDAAQ